MSTFNDIKTQVQYIIGDRTDTGTASLILNMFNHVQKVLARSSDWPELEAVATPTLVTGQQDYTASSLGLARFRKLYTFTLTSSSYYRKLDFLATHAWEEQIVPYLTSAPSGKPTTFTYFSKTFSLYPKPDSTYTTRLRYLQYPTVATTDSSVLQFDDADELLTFLTAGYCFAAIEEFEPAQKWLGIASALAKDMNISLKQTLNFRPSRDAISNNDAYNPSPWSDPFVRSNP